MDTKDCQCSQPCEKLPPILKDGPLPILEERRTELATMVQDLDLLFRVFDDKSISRLDDRGFVAEAYQDECYTPERISRVPISESNKRLAEGHIRHWSTMATPFVSTTPLWLWACMECIKRHNEKGRSCKIAVIDAKGLELHDGSGIHRRRVFYGLELLHDAHQHAQNWSSNPQEVLVFGSIPSTAILSIVDFKSLLDDLPPYLRRIPAEYPKTLGCLAWQWEGWNWFPPAHEHALYNFRGWMRGGKVCAFIIAEMAAALAISMLDAVCIDISEEFINIKEAARNLWEEDGSDTETEAITLGFMEMKLGDEPRNIVEAKENAPLESIEELQARAQDALDTSRDLICNLAEKIASFGFDWDQDNGDRAWQNIRFGIESAWNRKFEDEFYIFAYLDDLDELFDPW